MRNHHIIFFCLVGIISIILLRNRSVMTQKPTMPGYTDTSLKLWDYQCIDTMKTSRDKARAWVKDPNLENKIEKEMAAISDMGANCVAIDTPYDNEFSSYLTLWINKAREKKLHIWFRGNFAQWEHWFDYSGELTENDLFTKAQGFISTHPTYFEDGDIFTIAPEGENGGPFDQVEIDEYDRFRKFLVKEYQVCTDSFKKLGKNIECNWLSMNGGFARRMLSSETVTNIGNRVTIDHYIKTPEEMGEYIQHFSDRFNTNVVIGEFGAPIPDINGKMNDAEQANFIKSLFQQIYIHKDQVGGLCYWTLYDGSTALLNEDYSRKPVTQVIKNYYKPGMLKGIVTDKLGVPLNNIKISTTDGYETTTDKDGKYELLVPAGDTQLLINGDTYGSVTEPIHISNYTVNEINKYLSPTNPGLLYKIRLKLLQIS